MPSYDHVTAPIARRILVLGERPTHRLLSRAYLEAEQALAEDERRGELGYAILDARAANLERMGPGLEIEHRLAALERFWGTDRPRQTPPHLPAANDNAHP